jgi:O-antigen ligase
MELLNPFISAKVLWLQASVALALPFYVHSILSNPALRPNLRNPVTLAALMYVIIALIAAVLGVNRIRSFWGSYDRMDGVYYLVHVTLLYFYLVLIAKTKGEVIVRRLLALLVGLAVVSSLYGIWIALGMPAWVPSSRPRVSSFFGNPGYFAAFLILPIALTVLFWHQAKARAYRIWYLVLLALQLTGVIISGTRAAVIGVAAAAIVAGLALTVVKCRSFSLRTAIALISAPVILILLLSMAARSSHAGLFQRLARIREQSTRTRIIEWGAAWRGYRERPLLGTGSGNYYVVANKYFEKELYKYERANLSARADKPHNYLLEVLVTTGLAGLLAYLGMLGGAGFAFWRAYRQTVISWTECVILIGGMAAYTVQNLFWFDTPASSVAFYVYLGLAASLWMKRDVQAVRKPGIPRRGLWQTVAVALTAAVSLYAVCVTDGGTAVVLRDINNGITAPDAQSEKAYFGIGRAS